jgi:tRNA threonylcarbamoyladenosine biosynthesis protein TsaB
MPILDAKRDQVFAAVYRRQGHALDEVQPPQLIHLPQLLALSPRPLLVLGEGIKYHQQHLGGNTDVALAPEDLWYPKASTVAHLAVQLKQQGAYADPFKLTPLYIRKPEAQERMEAGLLKHLEA